MVSEKQSCSGGKMRFKDGLFTTLRKVDRVSTELEARDVYGDWRQF